jgi:hypothetical protein
MRCGFTCWFKSILLMAVLFGALGGMGSYWYFFWENRKMCPCAPAGLENAEGIAVAQPYSDELMLRRSLSFGGAGVLLGIAVGMAAIAPRANRLRRLALEDGGPGADS